LQQQYLLVFYNRVAVAQISYLDRKEEAPTGFAALFSSSKLF